MQTTNIEWTDATVNFWWGCTKVSPGCANCYAENLSSRFGKKIWGNNPREDHRDGALKLAFKLERQAIAENRRIKVFSNSMSDWLDPAVPTQWLSDMLYCILKTPHLDWQLLTKRPELFIERMQEVANLYDVGAQIAENWLNGNVLPNIWIGTTVEDQQRADERIPHLLMIPANIRFLSCEPLLEPVNLNNGHPKHRKADSYHAEIHWIIVGGESGNKHRPFDPDWARSIRNQCQAAGIAFFMKQMGGNRKPFPKIPEDLQIKQFPKT